MTKLWAAVLLGVTCGVTASALATANPSLSADEVKQRWSSRLDGLHFTATVRLVVDRGDQREERQVLVWRDDEQGTRERLMARFEAPYDLRGVGLLYLENTERANDYFFYQSTTRRVRRIPEAIAREDIYGIDLEFLGFGVAHTEPTSVESVEPVRLGEQRAFRLVERARQPNRRFERRTVWLDRETFVPLRTEHARDGRTTLIGATEDIRVVQGVPTPMRLVFERPLDRETVTMIVETIDYEASIPAAYFSTLALIK